jgi:hypothetical protein
MTNALYTAERICDVLKYEHLSYDESILERMYKMGRKNKEWIKNLLDGDHFDVPVTMNERIFRGAYPYISELLAKATNHTIRSYNLAGNQVTLANGNTVKITKTIRKYLTQKLKKYETFSDMQDIENVPAQDAQAMDGLTSSFFEAKNYFPKTEDNVCAKIEELVRRIGELLSTKINVYMSIRPEDLFMISENVPYVSCLRPGGEYFSGATSYAIDSHTIVIMILDHNKRQVGRTVMYLRDGVLISSRQYGNIHQAIIKQCREFIQNKINNTAQWRSKCIDDQDTEEEMFSETRGHVYIDTGYFYISWDTEKYASADEAIRECQNDPFNTPDAMCIDCGSYYDGYATTTGSCSDCETTQYECCYCNENCPEDEATYVNGVDGLVCRHCLENYFFFCPHCHEYCEQENDMMYIEYNDTYVCVECSERYYTQCELCDYFVPNNNIEHTDNLGAVCDDCAHELCTVCEYCEETVLKTDTVKIEQNERVCNECIREYYTQCKVCGKWHETDEFCPNDCKEEAVV